VAGAIRDTEFFRRAQDLELRNAVLAAFGATRRPGAAAARDPQVTALLTAETPVVTVVAKSDSRHVERALRTDRPENLAMVADTVRHLVRAGRRVVVDASTSSTDTAPTLGTPSTSCSPPPTPGPTRGAVRHERRNAATGSPSRRRDRGSRGPGWASTATTTAAARWRTPWPRSRGGEPRAGHRARLRRAVRQRDLFAVVANLVLKRGVAVLAPEELTRLSSAARDIAAVTGVPRRSGAPYVGPAAFTHKAACTPRPCASTPTSTSTSTRPPSVEECASWSPTWPGGRRWS
jgi:2-isopropylmalate synthase